MIEKSDSNLIVEVHCYFVLIIIVVIFPARCKNNPSGNCIIALQVLLHKALLLFFFLLLFLPQ